MSWANSQAVTTTTSVPKKRAGRVVFLPERRIRWRLEDLSHVFQLSKARNWGVIVALEHNCLDRKFLFDAGQAVGGGEGVAHVHCDPTGHSEQRQDN